MRRMGRIRQMLRGCRAAGVCVASASVLSVLSVLSLLTAQPLRAQPKRPFNLIELAELPRMFSPQLSPDGATLAYFLSSADWKSNRLVFHLWRQPIGGAAQQLTFTEA